MWLLQRICDANRPFCPLPAHFNGFKRGVKFYNANSNIVESVFVAGNLVAGLGSDFALYNGRVVANERRPWTTGCSLAGVMSCSVELVAACLLIEYAKAHIMERSLESDLILQASNPPQHEQLTPDV